METLSEAPAGEPEPELSDGPCSVQMVVKYFREVATSSGGNVPSSMVHVPASEQKRPGGEGKLMDLCTATNGLKQRRSGAAGQDGSGGCYSARGQWAERGVAS